MGGGGQVKLTCKVIKCIHPGRVHTHGRLDQWRGGALLAGQRMTIVAAVGTMDMKEVRAFSRMEEAHEITMKIRGAIITTVFISPLNGELVHLRGG